MLKIKTILTLALLFSIFQVYGQENTQSPYSMFGIGLLNSKGFDMNNAMGGTGIGLRKGNKINLLNPASFTSQDTMSFLFDVGVSGTFSNYKSSSAEQNFFAGNIDHIALGFPVTKWWKSAIALTPYSSMGYDFTVKETDKKIFQYAGNIEYQYIGKGNINTLYFGNAFKLTENISVGVGVNYVFGTLKKSYNMRFVDNTNSNGFDDTFKDIKYHISDFAFEFGAQYSGGDKKLSYTLGATIATNSKLSVKQDEFFRIERFTSKGAINIIDTITFFEDKKTNYKVPLTFGVGGSVNFNKKLLVAADFRYSQYDSDNVLFNQNNNVKQNDSWYTGIGLEYTPNYIAPKGYYKRINYRLGGFVEKTPYNINNTDIYKYGLTVGLGLPSRYSKTSYNISAQFGVFGTQDNRNIEEKFAKITLSINFHDIWFIKRKYD